MNNNLEMTTPVEVTEETAIVEEEKGGFDFEGGATLGFALVGVGTTVYGLYRGVKWVVGKIKVAIANAKDKKAEKANTENKDVEESTEE